MAKTKHKGKYNDSDVEVFAQFDGDPLTDGWYVADGKNTVKVEPSVLFDRVELDDYDKVMDDALSQSKARLAAAVDAAQNLQDFYDLGAVLAEAQLVVQSIVQGRSQAVNRQIEQLRERNEA